jgi:hypothetical protein
MVGTANGLFVVKAPEYGCPYEKYPADVEPPTQITPVDTLRDTARSPAVKKPYAVPLPLIMFAVVATGPLNVLLPATDWFEVRSTQFCVVLPVPPFPTGTTPVNDSVCTDPPPDDTTFNGAVATTVLTYPDKSVETRMRDVTPARTIGIEPPV